MRPTLLWAKGRCLNAPNGAILTYFNNPLLFGGDWWQWQADWSGACGVAEGKGYKTRDAARCTLEAMLWREGVMPLPKWFKSTDPDFPDYSMNVAEVSATVEPEPFDRWGWYVRVAPETSTRAGGDAATEQEAKHMAKLVMRAIIADELLKV